MQHLSLSLSAFLHKYPKSICICIHVDIVNHTDCKERYMVVKNDNGNMMSDSYQCSTVGNCCDMVNFVTMRCMAHGTRGHSQTVRESTRRYLPVLPLRLLMEDILHH